MKAIYFLLAIPILFAGCVNIPFLGGGGTQIVGQGLAVTMTADPAPVLTSDNLRIYIDLENKDERKITDVTLNVFDIGILQGFCDPFIFGEMLPGQFKTYTCYLTSPGAIASPTVTTEVNSKVTFKKNFKVTHVVEMASEEYYYLNTENFQKKSGNARFNDNNLDVLIEFNNDFPILVREGRKGYLYFTLTNIGNGYINEISSVRITPLDPSSINIFNNCFFNNLEPIDRTFPRMSCELFLPPDTQYLTNYGFTIDFDYEYEVRSKTPVEIIR